MTPEPEAAVGVIGGSGLYEFEMLTDAEEVELTTPYGDPSGPLVVGELNGRRVAFLARHGRRHELSPSEVPATANIYALKSLGVTEIVSVCAVGSLREHLRPGELAVPDQLVDLTRGIRRASFFGAGLVAHLPFADPYCSRLRPLVTGAAERVAGVPVHDGGTYVCIEGPRFSTRAESELYRSWGLDLIGMTAAPEAQLAREAGLCFAVLALVTDYDCWRQGHEAVTADMVAAVMRKNVAAAQATVAAFLADAPGKRDCGCAEALSEAILSDRSGQPEPTHGDVDIVTGRSIA